jgi:hypothetical protein
MDTVIQDLVSNNIISEQRIVNAFRCFLIPKPIGAAHFIMDISLTLDAVLPNTSNDSAVGGGGLGNNTIDQLIKIDLTSGFYQIPICPQHKSIMGSFTCRRHTHFNGYRWGTLWLPRSCNG